MTTSLALPGGALSVSLKLRLEFARELPGGVMPLELQHVIARRDLDQDADVASYRDGHADVRTGGLQDVEQGLVEPEAVVGPAVLPVLQLDDQVDGRPLAHRGQAEQVLDVDDADAP